METLPELLLLPSSLFLRAAYKLVLGREADKTGLHYYMEALSQGFGKDSVLISLMDSDEARRLTGDNKPRVASASPDVLSRELVHLRKAHNKWRFAHRIFRRRKSSSRRKDLNILEFRLESMFLSMLDQVKSEILQGTSPRMDLHHEVAKPAQNNSRIVNVIQAQRRSVSRPGREG